MKKLLKLKYQNNRKRVGGKRISVSKSRTRERGEELSRSCR
jgi:hypothetical protein